MINSVGLSSLIPKIFNTSNLATSIDASVQVIDVALDKGTEWFKTYQRGGITLNSDPTGQAGTFDYASYSQSFNNTVSYIQSGAGMTDDYRYAEDVGYV